ncbi:MAG: NADH-quinone oxidoreductase subunit C [Clostridiales bacterium]|nr:NADH-quinone oxidoreductase subunit C [Clostridiales bacterium]
MNSMNSIVDDLKGKFDIINVVFPDDMQMAVDVDKNDVHTVLSYLKTIGYKQLSLMSGVDWIKENEFEVVFIVFNWDNGIHILLRTRLDRENPVFRTITGIYPGAQYYERDIHEFFGIEFEGNPMSYKDLFLELWDEMPPMRKDFDPLAYSQDKFPERKYESQFIPEVGVIK